MRNDRFTPIVYTYSGWLDENVSKSEDMSVYRAFPAHFHCTLFARKMCKDMYFMCNGSVMHLYSDLDSMVSQCPDMQGFVVNV